MFIWYYFNMLNILMVRNQMVLKGNMGLAIKDKWGYRKICNEHISINVLHSQTLLHLHILTKSLRVRLIILY